MSYRELVPDPAVLIQGLRDTGYDLNTAIADIVDNSVDAFANNINVRIELLSTGKPRVTITDDGCGMTLDELIDGMQYGSKSSREKSPARLGKFGLGMKTASTAFCRRLSVVSRSSSDSPYYMAIWDLDHVVKNNSWDLEIKEQSEIPLEFITRLELVAKEGHGTIVVWENIDRFTEDPKKISKKIIEDITEKFKKYASMIYHKFLDTQYTEARNIIITINNEKIIPFDPFCKSENLSDDLNNPGTVLLQSIKKSCQVMNKNGDIYDASFQLKAYILPNKDDFSSVEAMKAARITNHNMGFYVYRENRMIVDGDWLDTRLPDPHDSLCRIEFNFNHELDVAFKIDVKKSKVSVSPDLEEFLRSWSRPAQVEANRRYRDNVVKRNIKRGDISHSASDKNILNHEKESLSADITLLDKEPDYLGRKTVSVSNVHNEGSPVEVRIILPPPETDGITIIPEQDYPDMNTLWYPTIKNGHHAVLLNIKHPFYQKVYLPNKTKSVVSGIDALL